MEFDTKGFMERVTDNRRRRAEARKVAEAAFVPPMFAANERETQAYRDGYYNGYLAATAKDRER